MEIFTRFSLFQIYDHDTLSVHRLIQEAIRNDIDDSIELKRVLGYATRMVNKGNNKITELRTILQRESPNS